MNIKFLLCSFLFATCASAQADWFLRGTQNNWGSAQMTAGGTNTVELKNVSFSSAGSVKFDRFGDWSQNYGIGGANGGNIPVAAGTWDIKFYTDSKNWNISRAVQYHLRGTHNNWEEGNLLTPVTGSPANYEACRNFGEPSATVSPRFKIDPNGGWGADAFPAIDYSVSGWTKIIVSGSERKIVSVTPNLFKNCVGPLTFTLPGPISMHVGETLQNRINVSADWLFYSSDKSSVAWVGGDGSVHALGVGTTTIRAVEETSPCLICASRGASYTLTVLP